MSITKVPATKATDLSHIGIMRGEYETIRNGDQWMVNYLTNEAKSVHRARKVVAYKDGKEVSGYATKKYSKKQRKDVPVVAVFAKRLNSGEPSSFKFYRVESFDQIRFI